MASFSSGLNPDVIRTLIDGIWRDTFSGKKAPNLATAESDLVFKQDTADSSAVVMDLFKGVGAWEQRPDEEQDIPTGTPRVGNQKIFTMAEFDKSIDIPKIFFDDQKHGAYERMVESFARRARTTRDKNAFAIFRNGFNGTFTTSDGVALFSDSHVSMSGQTVDNKLTAALSESSLNDAIVALSEMKSQDGEIDGFMPRTLLVPMKLFKTACEIVDSELRQGTADNDMNVYSSKYDIFIKTTPYLGAAAGGSDTAWFLIGEDSSITRWVRQPIETDFVNYKHQRNNVYIYKGSYRECVGAMSYEGVIGSDGTT